MLHLVTASLIIPIKTLFAIYIWWAINGKRYKSNKSDEEKKSKFKLFKWQMYLKHNNLAFEPAKTVISFSMLVWAKCIFPNENIGFSTKVCWFVIFYIVVKILNIEFCICHRFVFLSFLSAANLIGEKPTLSTYKIK